MSILETQPTTATGSWKLAFGPDYALERDGHTYAGYIFRLDPSHTDLIRIPDEASAAQVVAWLNEREALLVAEHEEAVV